MGKSIFFHRICPSLIHICFLVVLAGHFLSLVTGFNQVLSAKPGAVMLLPGNARIEVVSSRLEYYTNPEVLDGSLRQGAISLKCQKAGELSLKRLNFVQPCFWQGFSMHLSMNKKSAKTPGLRLLIRKDPGLKLILPGFIALILLMGWYFLRYATTGNHPRFHKN